MDPCSAFEFTVNDGTADRQGQLRLHVGNGLIPDREFWNFKIRGDLRILKASARLGGERQVPRNSKVSRLYRFELIELSGRL